MISRFLVFVAVITLFSCKKEGITEGALVQTAVKQNVGNNIGGYYVALPSRYNSNHEQYPLLLFLHGAGQLGNGDNQLPLLLNDGPAKLISQNNFPGSFNVNGQSLSFIVFTPQFKTLPSVAQVKECLDFIKSSYRIDASRIYIMGISMGAELAIETAVVIPNQLAAIVPMAGIIRDYASTNKCQTLARTNLPVWAFHSQDDPIFPVSLASGFVNTINYFTPSVPAKLTVWPNGGHDAWTRAIDPAYKEEGRSVYEWMLQYRR